MSNRSDLNEFVGSAVQALAEGNETGARIMAIWAGIALERLAVERDGADVSWPEQFDSEPLRGWCERGVGMERRQASQPASIWLPRLGSTHAAHTAGRDE